MSKIVKTVIAWFVVGAIVALCGILSSVLLEDIFNGFPNGLGAVLGICAYLCVVVITCTGIIVAKLDALRDSKGKESE
ncbi:MAG: hypothetical protein HUJ67_07805 [Ruminiclostridium sp.]|nr:hypothetical protein [Ruminiclostridium sp.]